MLRRLYIEARRLLHAQLDTPPRRARAAIVALLLACAGDVYMLRDVALLWRPASTLLWEPDDYAARFHAVRPLLPPDARVGYMNFTFEDLQSLRHDLIAARFALLPRCVVPGVEAPYLLVQGDPTGRVDLRWRRTVLDDQAQRLHLFEQIGPP